MPIETDTMEIAPYTRALKSLGDRIVFARKEKGWRQKDLAVALSQSQETRASRITVGIWEKGETIPSLVHLFGIASACGIDPVWLIHGKADDAVNTAVAVVQKGIVARDGRIEITGEIALSRDYFKFHEGPMETLVSLEYLHGNCEFGTMDIVIIDPRDRSPEGRPEVFAYMMSPGEFAIACVKQVAPQDGRKRVHVKNSDLMIDDTLFLDETPILGRVIRWGGR